MIMKRIRYVPRGFPPDPGVWGPAPPRKVLLHTECFLLQADRSGWWSRMMIPIDAARMAESAADSFQLSQDLETLSQTDRNR